MREKAIKLREERGQLVADARRILSDESLSIEDRTSQFDEAMAKAEGLKAEIDRIEQLLKTEDELAERVELQAVTTGVSTDQVEANAAAEDLMVRAYCRGGFPALDEEQRSLFTEQAGRIDPEIQATMSTGTGSEGGFVIPQGFSNQIDIAMLQWANGLLDPNVVTVLNTGTGNDIPYPTTNDTANKGRRLADNAAVQAQDVAFGQVMLKAWIYSSDVVKVPIALAQDSYFDFNSLLARLLGERLGRIIADEFTTGTGTAQPEGIVTGSTLGTTAASATAIAYPELIDLEHSVDPAYRAQARYMFNDDVLKILRKLVDGDSRPLWSPGMAFNAPDTIHNYPYQINQSMASPAIDAVTMVFGDLKKYLSRVALGMTLVRLTELYAGNLQIGFMSFMRADGRVIDAGTNPIKHLVQAAA